jgi:hypothetical protein
MSVEPLPNIRNGILVERLVQTSRYVADMRRRQYVVQRPEGARAVRRALTDGFRVRLDAWMKLVPGRSVAARREKALVTMATLVGALIIARAVDDPAPSDEVLEATETELRRR